MTEWKGTWRNQYGSTLVITDDTDGLIVGEFTTALEDSGFYGRTVPIYGMASGDVMGCTSATGTKTGPVAVSYTGVLRDGKLTTMWFLVASNTLTSDDEGKPAHVGQLEVWRAFTTSLDTFERVE